MTIKDNYVFNKDNYYYKGNEKNLTFLMLI